MEITHIFPGYLHFHALDMIQTILDHSQHKNRFIIYCNPTLNQKYIDLAAKNNLDQNRLYFINTEGLLIKGKIHPNRIFRLIFRIGISFQTLKIILFSSRFIVSHCLQWQAHALIMARLSGKRISWICWGDIPRMEFPSNRLMQQYYQFKTRLCVRLYDQIITLMTSDKRTIESAFKIARPIIVQPYPARGDVFELKPELTGRRILLLGNSASLIMYYPEVLDAIDITGWDEIICMLNYGHESKQDEVDVFVQKYKERFGKKFNPWRKVVPYEEYLNVLSKSTIYASPCPRQIGLGAIYPMIAMGKKVFVNGSNYQWLKDLGVVAFNLMTENLADTDQMCQPLKSTEKIHNISILHEILEIKNNMRRWDRIYTGSRLI